MITSCPQNKINLLENKDKLIGRVTFAQTEENDNGR